MSGDHKASLLLKNVEEERAQMDAMRQPVVEEKDEERRAEESDMSKEESEEASNSESDSGTVIPDSSHVLSQYTLIVRCFNKECCLPVWKFSVWGKYVL